MFCRDTREIHLADVRLPPLLREHRIDAPPDLCPVLRGHRRGLTGQLDDARGVALQALMSETEARPVPSPEPALAVECPGDPGCERHREVQRSAFALHPVAPPGVSWTRHGEGV